MRSQRARFSSWPAASSPGARSRTSSAAPPTSVEATWYALLVIGIVIVIDLSRTIVSRRASRRYRSAALGANALHFGSDLAGSGAVLIGLLLVRAGHGRADSAAALFVAVLVLVAAARLMKRNIDVLMDRAPVAAEEAALAAIAGIEPAVSVGRLRMRQAGSRQFADVVIRVPPGAAVGQGHAAADQRRGRAPRRVARQRHRRPRRAGRRRRGVTGPGTRGSSRSAAGARGAQRQRPQRRWRTPRYRST